MRVTVLIFILMLTCQVPVESRSGVGQKAIDFTLKTFDGKPVSLKQMRGKVILLDFWATWCPPCREELPFLDILQETFGTQGFVVLAINIDNDPENAREFLRVHDIELDPLWDEQKKIVARYDIEQMPTTMIIDKSGTVRRVFSGFEAEQYLEYKKEIQKLLREPGNRNLADSIPDNKNQE
jgi:peroxiredoxin